MTALYSASRRRLAIGDDVKEAQIVSAGAVVPTHNHPCIFSHMGSAACYFFSKSLGRTESIYFVLKDEAAGIIDVFCTAKAEEESRHPRTELAGGLVWCLGLKQPLRRLETAVTSCTGANGFRSIMLLGTPCTSHSSAATPDI
jgi:hypothetical protein